MVVPPRTSPTARARTRLAELLLPTGERARIRRDRALAVAAAICALLLIVRALNEDAGVLLTNQGFGARFLAGEDPYLDTVGGQRVHGPYPPSFALVCAPLSLLPTVAARLAWVLLQCGALVWLFVLLRRRTQSTWPALAPHVPLLYAGALLLVSRYLLRDMAAGGGNLLYLTLAYHGLESALAGRELRAGLPIALGLVTKPSLGLLLVFHALRARWRTVLSSLALALVLFLLPAAWYGPGRYLELARDWVVSVVDYAEVEELHDSSRIPGGMPPAREAMNQSLREAVHRFLRPPGDTGAADVRLLHASARTSARVSRALSLALLLACAAAALRARDGRREWLAGMAFVPLCLLLSPVTWKAHHVVLLPVFFGLLAEASAFRSRALLAFLAAYYLACDLLSQEVAGHDAKQLLQAVSLVTWAALAVLVVVLVRALRGGTVPRTSPPDSHRPAPGRPGTGRQPTPQG